MNFVLNETSQQLPAARALRRSCLLAARGHLVTCTCRLVNQSPCLHYTVALPGTWAWRRTVRTVRTATKKQKPRARRRLLEMSDIDRQTDSSSGRQLHRKEAAMTSLPVNVEDE